MRSRHLRRVIDEHFDFVWRSVRRLGVPEADVDDATQEVFLVLARRLEAVQAERERAFLFGTALRVAATRRRSQRRHREEASDGLDQQAAESMNPEELAQLSQARGELQQILDKMPMKLRSVFILYELEQSTMQEVAQMLDVPLGTVSWRLREARAQFQKAVERLTAQRNQRAAQRSQREKR